MMRNKRLIGNAAGRPGAVFVLLVALNAAISSPLKSQATALAENHSLRSLPGIAGSSWPKNQGIYIANSSERIPAFPRALSGYRSEENKDFWNKTFASTGSIRIFEGKDWTGIPDFPATMNGCTNGVFMIRWRSGSPDVRIASNLGSHDLNPGASAGKIGEFGYMYGTNCEQPMFKFAGAHDKATLADVYYELKFWQAAP
jgi:hypothetical protein